MRALSPFRLDLVVAASHSLGADEAERAVSDERTRIAGELHDIVAHALSAMTVQASGARRLVASDPARVSEAFAAVEATGRDALDELRRLLGVLRRDDEELALAPQPSLRHVGSLIRRAGLPVDDDDVRRAAEERRRIARELHDLVAHSMSVMVVQAGGAGRTLDRDPGRALEAAERIERTGREALAEMRHLLGVLHPGDEPRALAPQPTLSELDALIARAREAGLRVVLHEDGERRPLPAGLDLAAYRIVQEALTNAFEHAGGATTEVTVTWGAPALAIEVRDRGRARVGGDGAHGLVGMRERVRVYGGELETGPARGGGWRVRATLPLVSEMASA